MNLHFGKKGVLALRRYLFHTIQGRIVGILLLFMGIMLVTALVTTQSLSQTVMLQGKEDKLLGIAEYLVTRLEGQSFDDILAQEGALDLSQKEQLAVLNRALGAVTEEVASIYPGLGVGYYSRELDAILTYGPSSENGGNVGVAIGSEHPGRTVMEENQAMVKMGSMVRGKIMNAMYPIQHQGMVIGYTWANELTTNIEQEFGHITARIIAVSTLFFVVTISVAVFFSRRLMKNVDTLVAGIKEMPFDLTKRIGPVSGELGEVAESLNLMAEHMEKTAKEHEARLLAEAANLAQRDFLARMSHELRTPMNGVLGMTRLAMQAETKEQSAHYLHKIQSSATLLLGIINDILDFSKIEAGKMELESHPFLLGEITDNIRELLEPRAAEKGLRFTVEVEESVPQWAVGDSVKLSQVLLNLAGNAVKFTKTGEVRLTVKAAPEEGGRIRLACAVSDTGIGMSPEQTALLFKPFSQADSSTVREFGGTGLGLSITKTFVEMMSGAITVTSQPGEGSIFAFFVLLEAYAPLVDSPEAGQPEEGPQIYENLSVLLAEDNEINREIALAVLEEFGMKADCAENGEEAVRAFQEGRYDLIFMDIRMPLMDGLEATMCIRALEAERGSPSVPIIAMTANAMQVDRVASREAGMDGHISKPLDMAEIEGELRRVLRGAGKSREGLR